MRRWEQLYYLAAAAFVVGLVLIGHPEFGGGIAIGTGLVSFVAACVAMGGDD